jgi:hypothetical protein
MEFVSTAAITAATTLDVLGFEAGFDYSIQLEAFGVTTESQALEMLFSDDGSTFESDLGDYRWKAAGFTLGGTFTHESTSATEIGLTGDGTTDNDAVAFMTMKIDIYNPMGTSEPTTALWSGGFSADISADENLIQGWGRFLQGTDAIQGVRFQWSGGSTFKAQGDITVYRRRRS